MTKPLYDRLREVLPAADLDSYYSDLYVRATPKALEIVNQYRREHAGVPQGERLNTFIECGCCGAYHRTDFNGDCREDSERHYDLPDDAVIVEECEVCSNTPDTGACFWCKMD
jgi:hypothetical protein